jgi:hypothetical protein
MGTLNTKIEEQPPMSATPLPWTIERHDQEDGTISYEIWSVNPPTYHRIVTLNDWDNKNAREDAELIVRAVNGKIC